MTNTAAYAPFTVLVNFENGQLSCDPNPLEIPADTIATITWARSPSSNFVFLTFEWLHSNGFPTQDPIVHNECVVSVVKNTELSTRGSDWPYVLKVQVGDRVYQTGSTEVGTNGKPVIHTQ
ncbi:MAG: hypothetical protein ACREPL_03625 [Rhodanobacteraceae bacterium]